MRSAGRRRATIELWRVNLPADPARAAGLRRLLSADEVARADRFRFDADRTRWTVSRAALRRVLECRSGTPADEIEFRLGPFGRPSLAIQRKASLHFSLSRRGALAVIAVSGLEELGVDVEEVAARRDLEIVAESQFSARERAALESVPESVRASTLLSCWTAKEAYVKAIGRGLSQPLQEFDIAVSLDEPPRMLAIGGSEHAARGWFLRRLDLGADHVGTVALHDPGGREFALSWQSALSPSDLSTPLDRVPAACQLTGNR